MVGKKIKKLRRKGLDKEVTLRRIEKIKKAAHTKLEREVLAKGDEMKQRKVKRKIQKERNVKKAGAFKKRAEKHEKAPKLKKVQIS